MGRQISQELKAAGEELLQQKVSYTLVCREKDDRTVRESDMVEWWSGKTGGSGRAATWRKQKTGGHACGRKK